MKTLVSLMEYLDDHDSAWWTVWVITTAIFSLLVGANFAHGRNDK